MTPSPYFSVLVPTKGRAYLLRDTISSVLDQSFSDLELVVVDNDDGEDTRITAQAFDDSRIVYVKTGGLCMADNWQAALDQARGSFVVMLADKCLLKRDALEHLRGHIKGSPGIGVITFEYDAYYDEERAYVRRSFGSEAVEVDSEVVVRHLLNSDFVAFSKYAPRGYNACIARELLDAIKARVGNVCLPVNPDYAIAYHLLLTAPKVLYLPYSPQVVRFRSLSGTSPYGNGGSYFYKGTLFDSFLRELEGVGCSYCDRVSIKAFLVYSVLLNDFLRIAAMHGWNDPDFDRVRYYAVNYRETMSRRSYGVDIRPELSAWRSAFRSESDAVRARIHRELLGQYVKQLFYKPYRALERSSVARRVLHALRGMPAANTMKHYPHLEEMLRRETCEAATSTS